VEYDALTMAEPYIQEYRARWADMDFNQHMRNAAYLGVAEETRFRFLESQGWSMEEFMRRQIGPVVLEDRLVYKKELRLLEPFRVDLAMVQMTSDARKFQLRNRFLRSSDGALCATVESFGLWFDIAQRRPVVPPPELARVWLSLARTEDYVALDG
jgi:acyl-CoA thioester hydrolase